MSNSIRDLLKSIASETGNVQASEGKLQNPDIPSPSKDFDESRNIKTDWYSDRKLGNQPRNGGQFALPRNTFTDDPRLDTFMQDGSIDPNNIRKQTDPDSAHPSIIGPDTNLFSLVEGNLESHNYVGLIQKARSNYLNYKNRFSTLDEGDTNVGDMGAKDTPGIVPSGVVAPSVKPTPTGGIGGMGDGTENEGVIETGGETPTQKDPLLEAVDKAKLNYTYAVRDYENRARYRGTVSDQHLLDNIALYKKEMEDAQRAYEQQFKTGQINTPDLLRKNRVEKTRGTSAPNILYAR